MNKVGRTQLKRLMMMAMAVMMIFSMAVPALAAGEITGTELAPAQAAITKWLTMAEGTATPAVTFTFSVTSKSVDGVTATPTNMPVIANKSVTFASTDVGSNNAGIKSVALETANIFAGVTWPHAGVYTYTIAELNPGTTGYTYSGASYDITAYVANGTNGLFIAAIGTEIMVTDGVPGTAAGDKVDPTPGGDPGVTGDFSELTFTNKYVKNSGGDDPTGADVALFISKTVAGLYGDRTKYFSYTLDVTKAASVSGTPTYKAYVVDIATNTVVTSADNYATLQPADSYGVFFNVSAGTQVAYSLKHGQKLVIPQAEVGTQYAANEAGVADYTPSVVITVDGVVGAAIPGSVNTSLATGTKTIGEDANSAAYTNTYKTVTPTGISVNDLPFIVMILLAVGALAAFIVVKSRRREVRDN